MTLLETSGQPIREDTWLHTGDILVGRELDKRAKTPAVRLVSIEKIHYHDDLTRSFVLAPVDSLNPKLYRTMTSEETLRRKYRRIHTNEIRIQ